MPSSEFDVCVIGTGAGGGVICQELTRAGFSVVALQRGPELHPSQFSDDELDVIVRDGLFAPEHLETWRPDEGTPAEPGRYNTMGHGVGGTLTRWAGWSWRLREDDFRVRSAEGAVPGADLADWPISYAELAPWYTRAEREFGVAGVAGSNPFAAPRNEPYPNGPHPDRRGTEIFVRGARALGYQPFPIPVAINPVARDGRPACIQGGACQGFGCPIHAKATSLSVCLPKARATGRLTLVSDAEVFEVPLQPDGRVRGARYLDPSGAIHEVRARRVVVAGNAVESARLLLLSTSGAFPDGLANGSGLVGRHLMLHHHAAVRMLVDEPARGYTGIEATRAIDDFHPSDAARGFIRGGVVAEVNAFTRQPLLYALMSEGDPELAPGFGAPLQRYLRDFPRAITLGSVLEDLPMAANRVDLDPGVNNRFGLPVARITHRQHANDIAMNHWFRARLLEIAEASGAERAWPMGVPGVTTVDETHPVRGSAHLHGTCRMGDDPSRAVLDRNCRSHDVPNLWVVDGSCFPSSAGYNPTLTILANAYRVADTMVRNAKRMDA